MNEERKYSIVEHLGVFTIMIWDYDVKGFLWWRKKVYDWHRTDIYGGRMIYGRFSFLPPCSRFKTLDSAKKMIELWKKGSIIHEVK